MWDRTSSTPPPPLGHADHGHVEVAALDHRLEGRKDLLAGEVAGGAEQHERVGPGRRSVAHAASRLPGSMRRTSSMAPTAGSEYTP